MKRLLPWSRLLAAARFFCVGWACLLAWKKVYAIDEFFWAHRAWSSLRGGAQGLPGCGRGVGLHQDLAAIFEVGFGAGAGGRFDPGVAPLQGPGLAVEGGQARAPGPPRRAGVVRFARIVRRARDRAARRTARNATRSNVRSVVRPEICSPRRHRHHGLAQAVVAQGVHFDLIDKLAA
jgi:hypothetical protein